MAVRDRSENEVDGRQPVVARTGELPLHVDHAPFNLLVDRQQGKSQEFVDQPTVVLSVTR